MSYIGPIKTKAYVLPEPSKAPPIKIPKKKLIMSEGEFEIMERRHYREQQEELKKKSKKRFQYF